MKNITFCSETYDPSIPNSMWEEEVKIANEFGNVYLMDQDAFLRGEVNRAFRRLPNDGEEQEVVYHGWMMTPVQYNLFYQELSNRNFKPITTPEAYRNCHQFPNWYRAVESFTPKSIIIENYDNVDDLIQSAQKLSRSIIIKDFVSSRKHSWLDACFIPDTRDIKNCQRVFENFIKEQKEIDSIQGGIILRKFVPLESIGTHPKSGMPLSQEFRAFVYKGKVISVSEYWEYGNYNIALPPDLYYLDLIAEKVFSSLGSNLFTVDFAYQLDAGCICIEIGDGQVSSLPDKADKKHFYSKLLSL